MQLTCNTVHQSFGYPQVISGSTSTGVGIQSRRPWQQHPLQMSATASMVACKLCHHLIEFRQGQIAPPTAEHGTHESCAALPSPLVLPPTHDTFLRYGTPERLLAAHACPAGQMEGVQQCYNRLKCCACARGQQMLIKLLAAWSRRDGFAGTGLIAL